MPERIRLTLRPSRAVFLFEPIWVALGDRLTVYTFTDDILSERKGILNKSTKMKDLCYLKENVELEKPLIYRFADFVRCRLWKKTPMNLQDIRVYPLNSNFYFLHLKAIPDGEKVADIMRYYIRQNKKQNGVRLIEN